VLVLFSQAMIAGEPLPHLTNFHDKLTNTQQTPLAIAGAARSPRVRCVQATCPLGGSTCPGRSSSVMRCPVHRRANGVLIRLAEYGWGDGMPQPFKRSPGDRGRVTGLARFEGRLTIHVRQCLILGAHVLTVFCSRRYHGLTYSRNESRFGQIFVRRRVTLRSTLMS